ncbi:MAG: STAS domain-containing protein [Ruminococcaceae bacterium]|nr:STAS domain-containing protein [Oscillospiraceae bacterium]
MKYLKPKLFECMKGYTKAQFVKDLVAGIIVAIIALPLSIALAIASGVSPEVGLFTAVIAGFFISFAGGSRVQIGGPTAAFVVIVAGIVADNGLSGLILATILAGIFLVLMGVFKLGSLIKYIPHTITAGFTCGIGVTLLVGQLKDFFGLKIDSVPSEFIPKIVAYAKNIDTVNFWALGIGALALVILIVFPKINKTIPASIIAIIVTTLVVWGFKLDAVPTIGSVFGELSSSLPKLSIPKVDLKTVKDLISPAFTIAILAAIESLLSCVVSDSMVNDKHNPNAELIGQGLGNIFSGLFGGIPATGAIARTAANVANGGRTPIAGIVHSITLLLITLLLMPLVSLIPMTTLAAVLLVVAWNMCGWKSFIKLIKTSPKSDVLIAVMTFVLTVVFDLVVAIEVGIVASAILLMYRMATVTDVKGNDVNDDSVSDDDSKKINELPESIRVFEISGPLFFAASDKIATISFADKAKVIIIRMNGVPSIDASAMRTMNGLWDRAEKRSIKIIMSHVNEQPLKVMKKDGFFARVGEDNFTSDIDSAIERAQNIVKESD